MERAWDDVRQQFFTMADGRVCPNPLAPHVESFYQQRLNALLASGEAVRETWFLHDGLVAQFSLIKPKSPTRVSVTDFEAALTVGPDEFKRAALKTYVLENNGLEIDTYQIAHLNAEYRLGVDAPEKLLSTVEVSMRDLRGFQEQVLKSVFRLNDALSNPFIPPEAPFEYCPEVDNDRLPQEHIYLLRQGCATAGKLRISGILALKDVPLEEVKADSHKIQINAARSGLRHIDQPALRKFLEQIRYPFCVLDFETFALPLPVIPGTKPFQQIPFQFSLTVAEAPGASARTTGYLHGSADDPRPALLMALRKALPQELVSVIAYNAIFERDRLTEMMHDCPETDGRAQEVTNKLVDLWEPFRNFSLYDPKQRGRTSFKAVLPAYTKGSYKDLAIQSGDIASGQYLRVVHQICGPVTDEDQKETLEALRKYCTRDTEAPLSVLSAIQKEAGLEFPESGGRKRRSLNRHADPSQSNEKVAGQLTMLF